MARRGGREEDRRAQGGETRQALVTAARALFAEVGFYSTSIAAVVERSAVGSRGAFYHHFADKAELFRAVYEEVERDLVLRFVAQPAPGDAWERFAAGLHGLLEAALEPEVQRIVLIDAPAVLGWEAKRAIEEANSIAAIEAVLRRAMDDGIISELPAAALAHVLSAAVEEAALLVAHAEDPSRARAAAGQVIDRLLVGLLPPVAKRRGAKGGIRLSAT